MKIFWSQKCKTTISNLCKPTSSFIAFYCSYTTISYSIANNASVLLYLCNIQGAKFDYSIQLFTSSISWELSAAYIIIKLSAYSKRHSICKIPMHCSKFHVMHYVILLLSTGRNECQSYSHRINHYWLMAQWEQC